MCLVRFFADTADERRLRELIASQVIKNAHPVTSDDGAPANPAIELVMLRWLLEA